MSRSETEQCSLCGRKKDENRKLIVGLQGAICSDCVPLCNDILLTGGEGPRKQPDDTSVLARLMTLTRRLADKGFVILGEGNTSARDGDTLWVKASGASMADIDPTGFSQVSLQAVLEALDLSDQSDDDLRQLLNDARVEPERDGYPSTETFMHAWLLSLPDVEFVAHTHPTATLGTMCGPRAAEFAAHRYFPDQIVLSGPRSVFVEYVAPGLELAQKIRTRCEEYTDESRLQPKTILLQNHGLIALGKTPNEALSATMMMEKAAAVFLSAREPVALSREEVAHIHDWADEHFRQGKIWED